MFANVCNFWRSMANKKQEVCSVKTGNFKPGFVQIRSLQKLVTKFIPGFGKYFLNWFPKPTWFYRGLGYGCKSNSKLVWYFALV